MRLFFTSLLLLFILQVGFAQTDKAKDNNTETVFEKGSIKFSGSYISPEVKIGSVYEDLGLFAGGKMGVSFNNRFLLGLGFYGLINNSDLIAERPSDYGFDPSQELASIKFIYGGLALEYSFFSSKVVHFNIPVFVGPGKVSIKGEKDIFFDRIEKSSVFVVEPGLALEFNLFRFLKVDLGASYRYVNGTTLEALNDKDLSDISYNIALKFDFFN
jgi:hypothetical protein